MYKGAHRAFNWDRPPVLLPERRACHLANWATLAPGTSGSAGKRSSAKIGKGKWLHSTLIHAAHVLVKLTGAYLAVFERRLVARRGQKKAIVAVAHSIVTIA